MVYSENVGTTNDNESTNHGDLGSIVMDKTNGTKLLLIVLVSISLLLLAFVGGTYFGWTKLGKATRSMERTFALSGYFQYTALEYQNASYPEAKRLYLTI